MESQRPVQQCPHCKLPLTRQESREPTCPVCLELLYDVEPNPDDLLDVDEIEADGDDILLDVDLPPEEQTHAADDQQAPAEARRRIGLAITIAAVLVMLIAGIVLTSIFSAGQDDRDPPPIRKNRVAAVVPEFVPATQPVGDDDPPADPPVAADVQAGRREDPQDIPDPLAGGLAPDQDLPDWGVKIRLDSPHGVHTVEPVNSGDRFLVSGKIKKLQIASINGQGAVATEKLAAEEVIITGGINGEGNLRLNAPGGSVTFLDSLNGASRVTVNAPGGKVTFGSADKSRRGGGSIVGSSHVTIIARDVDFRGVVDGGARVTVTLTEGGSLRFSMIAGGAHVHYRKAKPGDPAPKIERGKVTAGGKFARIEPPKPPASSPKIELDLTKLDASGLRGPADGKVSVAYEFCIPNTAKCKAQVKGIDPAVRLMPGSRGRIGAGKSECLCVGETGANYRTVLKRLADLPYVKRIIECHFE